MLRIYKSENGGKLVKLKKNKVASLSWYNMINPSIEEMEKVSDQLKLDFDMVKNALDLDERSRVEFEDNVLSLIVNLPLLDDDGKFDTLPCGMFFTKHNFVTICSRDNRILSSFNKNTAKTIAAAAGIQEVIVRENETEYTVYTVSDWIENDESLEGTFGY